MGPYKDILRTSHKLQRKVLTISKESDIIGEVSVMECRPMVGHLTLDQVIGVRIPALQPLVKELLFIAQIISPVFFLSL
jgi:hypothetical protein